ncbi:MAG TPA: DUF1592 domain-containing protein [Planctomycetota bacterium]|nr:DUF1592 domain-containing protein [Planctomycetota bacterium]
MRCLLFALILGVCGSCLSADALADFRAHTKPLLTKYCYGCHGDGANKGGLAFDGFASDDALIQNRELWFKVLKNVRARIMPPAKEEQPSSDEKRALGEWIKYGSFGLDPKNPDPGRVTLRRLNRIEYANTIHDLMGVDFKADEEFPPDDTGYGFDNIGDALNVSPLLLEKYMQAAETIVARAVPVTEHSMGETNIAGAAFKSEESRQDAGAPGRGRGRGQQNKGESKAYSFDDAMTVSHDFTAKEAGTYRITVDLKVNGSFDFDTAKCSFNFKIGDKELMKNEFVWQDGKKYHYEYDEKWEPGERTLTFHLEPLNPRGKRNTRVEMKIVSVQIRGPVEPEKWGRPFNWERFFTKDAPADLKERSAYAAEVLSRFAARAFRRPSVDQRTIDRLVTIAEAGYTTPGKSFEQGVAQAMVAVLASPRFLFRTEETVPPLTPNPSPQRGEGDVAASGNAGAKGESSRQDAGAPFSLIDEYSLASRLSYFLWSTMPDDELLKLAKTGALRSNLSAQIKRMLDDARSEALVSNFVGQWLQARDVDAISIDGRVVLARDAGNAKEIEQMVARLQELRAKREEELKKLIAEGKAVTERVRSPEEEQIRSKLQDLRKGPGVDFDGPLRTAMRRETEMTFDYILREDRSALELLDSDYTFLNEKLAKHYGIPNVFGDQMRRVTLPKDSARGGVLTQGTVLTVTSNPTRTSPVKRGLFILDNILGTPTRPAPPEVPPLEASEKHFEGGKEPSLREVLAVHREKPLCSSCHNQMDPLGLAFENFNALGMWRESEHKVPIDASGTLATGQTFNGAHELKKLLTAKFRREFYRCLTEKLLTYALGRGLEYYDTESVDQIVDRLEKNGGKFSALMNGIVESAPFQKRRVK